MQFVDELLAKLMPYVNDAQAVENIIYLHSMDYSIEKKETALVKYEGDLNETYLKKFLIAKRVKGCTPRTIENYKGNITKMLEMINKPVTDVEPDDIRAYIAVRLYRDKVSKTTCNNELRPLSSMYAWMLMEGIGKSNPVAQAGGQVKDRKKPKKAFTEEELVALRNELTRTRDKCVFEMLLSTACRVSELVNIKIDEINDAEIIVHGKGEKDRIVYVNAQAKYYMDKYLSERHSESPYLFPGNDNGHISASQIEAIIRRLGNRVGIEAYPHKFRRTSATRALRAGMPIEIVSKMLGHEAISTTQIYLDITTEQLKEDHRKYVR